MNLREKTDKYLDLARELKKLRNMKVTMILIVTCVVGTVTKGLVQGLEDLKIRRPVETIQTIKLLRSARILKRVRKNWRDLKRLAFTQREKPLLNMVGINSSRIYNNLKENLPK